MSFDRVTAKVVKIAEEELQQIAVDLAESPAKSFEEYLRRVHKYEGIQHMLGKLKHAHGGEEDE